VAEKTIEKFLARAVRLYEQEQGGVFRLPLAWTIREAVGQVGKRLPDYKTHMKVKGIHVFASPAFSSQLLQRTNNLDEVDI
jgi:hypothetical protein